PGSCCRSSGGTWPSTTTATAAPRLSETPTMHSPAPHAAWSSAQTPGAARPGAVRSKCRRVTRAWQTTGRCVLTRNGTIWACAAPTAPPFPGPATRQSSRSRLPTGARARLGRRVGGGPAFLVGQNFQAVYSYNPSRSYALALCHLGDLIRGDP